MSDVEEHGTRRHMDNMALNVFGHDIIQACRWTGLKRGS